MCRRNPSLPWWTRSYSTLDNYYKHQFDVEKGLQLECYPYMYICFTSCAVICLLLTHMSVGTPMITLKCPEQMITWLYMTCLNMHTTLTCKAWWRQVYMRRILYMKAMMQQWNDYWQFIRATMIDTTSESHMSHARHDGSQALRVYPQTLNMNASIAF